MAELTAPLTSLFYVASAPKIEVRTFSRYFELSAYQGLTLFPALHTLTLL